MTASAARVKVSETLLRGIVDLRGNPPSMVAHVLTYTHPDTHKQVTLMPVPNMAAPSYMRRAHDDPAVLASFDRVLCEDGKLPVCAGTPAAQRQALLRACLPFLRMRAVVREDAGGKFDGVVCRDLVESRMAYQMIMERYNPPVDPRARRGVERIDSYAAGTRVFVAWGVYHIPYFRYQLERQGYTLTRDEEVQLMSFVQMFIGMFVSGLLLVSAIVVLMRLLFGM